MNPCIVLLSADQPMWESLAGLLRVRGAAVFASAPDAPPPVDLVIVACDSWPPAWPSRLLRATFRRTPCLLLSGSPVSGPDTATGFARGFFAGLPMTGARFAELVASLAA